VEEERSLLLDCLDEVQVVLSCYEEIAEGSPAGLSFSVYTSGDLFIAKRKKKAVYLATFWPLSWEREASCAAANLR